MRILVLSDPIWLQPPSGYSKIADNLCHLLAKDGHSVGHIPIGGGIKGTSMLKGHTMTRRDTLLLEGGQGGDIMSENVALGHYYDFKADFLLTAKDIYNFRTLPSHPVNWVPMVPIDHRPLSPQVARRLNTCFKVISITRFGKRELTKAGVPSTYIPLFVNTDIYKPIDKAQARATFGIPPDSFTILIAAMNRRRKMIPRLLKACKRFIENNPDAKREIRVILWTSITPEFYTEDGARGVILGDVIERLGIHTHIFSPDPKLYNVGLEELRMPLLYNAADCILCGSAEGFWLPGIEGGACGIPSVVVEAGAAPEVTTGELARVADWDVMNPVGYEQPLVDIDSMAEGIQKIYNGDPEAYAKQAREYSVKYDMVDVYFKYWKPFLAQIEPILRPLVTKGGIKSWAIQ